MSVADWLQRLPEVDLIDRADIEDLRADLDAGIDESLEPTCDDLDADLLPLRLPKGRLSDLQRCERAALARFRATPETATGAAVLRGTALDHFVAHQMFTGRVREPVPDLTSMLSAAADHDSLGLLDDLLPEEAADLVEPMAVAVADAWAGIDPAWVPRVQSRASIVAGSGRCVCTGMLDVELGGGPTGRPGVVIEVKSGAVAGSHQDEVYLYALLVGLRDRVAPAVVARWYPGVDPVGVPVTLGVLEAAAARLIDGTRRWAELLVGRVPGERPGAWCRWCPDRAVCPSAISEDRGGR